MGTAPAERVLVLDDDEAVGRVVKSIAESVGMACVHVTGYVDFADVLEQWKPTHIVLDLMMPEIDGVEVTARLAARGCRAGVILMSGVAPQVLDAARRGAWANGLHVVDVLPKPFTSDMMRALLKRPEGASPDPRRRSVDSVERLPITAGEVGRAVRRGEFQLVYQPKVRCDAGSLVGYEALLRWRHPVHGRILPGRFIGLAEGARHLTSITQFVLEEGVAWLSRHPRSDLSLSMNVSAECLRDEGFICRLIDLCARYEVEPDRIVLELTETAATVDGTDILVLLTRLRLKGFHLSIDDFGTGYSSMAQLARLPFSEIKIDKSFVMSAEISAPSRSIIEATVDLGRRLDLGVVAEGVEAASTLEYLNAIGCEFVQGHLIARPMSGAAALSWPSELGAGELGAGRGILALGDVAPAARRRWRWPGGKVEEAESDAAEEPGAGRDILAFPRGR